MPIVLRGVWHGGGGRLAHDGGSTLTILHSTLWCPMLVTCNLVTLFLFYIYDTCTTGLQLPFHVRTNEVNPVYYTLRRARGLIGTQFSLTNSLL